MEKENNINCPNCGFAIDVNDLVYHQMEEELKKEFSAKQAQERLKLTKEAELLQNN